METNSKIAIRKAINQKPILAQGLKRNSKTFEQDVKEFAMFTKISEDFIRLNIDQIRNWID